MSYCSKCGTPIAEGSKFCPSCGTLPAAPQPPKTGSPPGGNQPRTSAPGGNPSPGSPESKLSAALATPDATAAFDPRDIEQNKVMAVLAYLGILVLIPSWGRRNRSSPVTMPTRASCCASPPSSTAWPTPC